MPLVVYAGGPRPGSGPDRFKRVVPLVVFAACVALVVAAGGEELMVAIKASGVFVADNVAQWLGIKPSLAQRAAMLADGTKVPVKVNPEQGIAAGKAAAAQKAAAAAEVVRPAVAKKQAAAVPAPKPKVIVEVDDKGRKLQILDTPIPEYCHPEPHSDYDGFAVQWGLGHKVASATECCEMCRTFKQRNPDAQHPCNIWVWCPDPSGICWTMDIWNHTTGDCWLKYQEAWDNNPDRKTTNLKVNHRGKFSDEFRQTHRSSPEHVPWIAGVIPKAAAAATHRQR